MQTTQQLDNHGVLDEYSAQLYGRGSHGLCVCGICVDGRGTKSRHDAGHGRCASGFGPPSFTAGHTRNSCCKKRVLRRLPALVFRVGRNCYVAADAATGSRRGLVHGCEIQPSLRDTQTNSTGRVFARRLSRRSQNKLLLQDGFRIVSRLCCTFDIKIKVVDDYKCSFRMVGKKTAVGRL